MVKLADVQCALILMEALEEAIENFNGTLLVISHDRFFIDRFADKIIEIVNGKATTYIGNYEDYQTKKSGNM